MALVSGCDLIAAAAAEKYAVGGFNVFNLEVAAAVIAAAEAERAPVFLQIGPTGFAHGGFGPLTAACRALAEEARVPVALHLDHAQDFAQVVRAFRAGFTSLMYDGAAQPYAENAAVCGQVCALARPAGVMVEGELGRIGGNEEGVAVAPEDEDLTDPGEAERFVAETGVDALAVAVGTAHGRVLKGGALRHDRIAAIHARAGVPLVLHGASGVPDDDMRQAIAGGIAKVNVATETNRAFLAALSTHLPDGITHNDPRGPLAAARSAAQAAIQGKLRVFGSSGRAAG